MKLQLNYPYILGHDPFNESRHVPIAMAKGTDGKDYVKHEHHYNGRVIGTDSCSVESFLRIFNPEPPKQ